MKELHFEETSLDDLRAFPTDARKDAGKQLDKVQNGQTPNDWKPMKTIGPGVAEIRVDDPSGIFRVMYVAKFAEGVFVLHCFKKTTQKTSQHDIDVTTRRYKNLVGRLRK